jgi:hypothetical protein
VPHFAPSSGSVSLQPPRSPSGSKPFAPSSDSSTAAVFGARLWHDSPTCSRRRSGTTRRAISAGGDPQLFVEQVGQASWARGRRIYPHIALTVITLSADGRSARARWRIVAMLGGYGGGASFARGVYENAYANEGGVWKVQEITFSNQVSGRYGESLKPTVSGSLDAPSAAFHYEPGDAGAVLAHPGAAQGNGYEASFGVLAARLGTLERRAERLTAESEVLNLQNAYGYYVDRKLWDDVADLFADTGTMEIGQGGVYVGKASIRRGLEQFGPAGLRGGSTTHPLRPIVTVAADGASAKARGVYLGMTGRVGAGAEWREGLYENEYVRDGGVGRSRRCVYPRLVTDYDKGWARTRSLSTRRARRFHRIGLRPRRQGYRNSRSRRFI